MRTALWILGLFAAAVAVALLAVSNAGTVSIFLPTRRVDLSLNLALLLLALAFALVHAALNALRKLFELPAEARQWRSLQRERGAHAALLDAWIYWRAGRYVRAREAARLALARELTLREAGESLHHGAAMQALAHTVLAESAYALREPPEREAQLQQGLAVSREGGGTHLLTETQHGLLLRAAQWALIERDPERALHLLHALGRGARRRTAALRLQAQATEMAGRPLEAFELTRLLRKHGDLSDAAALRRLLPLAEAAAAQTRSLKALRAIWQQLADWPEHDAPSDPGNPSNDAAAQQAGESWRLRMATGLRLVTRALQIDAGGGQGTLQADVWLHALWDSAMGDLAGARAPDEGVPPDQGGARAGQAGDRLTPELWEQLVATLEALLVALDGRPEQQAWLARIESARRAAPQVAGLQYLAGMVALSRSAWDEARRLLARAALGLPSPRLQRQAWRALARLAEAQGRSDEAHHAWQQAAMVD